MNYKCRNYADSNCLLNNSCINCHERHLLSYYKEKKLEDIEGFVDKMIKEHKGAYGGSSGHGRWFVARQIKKILEDK